MTHLNPIDENALRQQFITGPLSRQAQKGSRIRKI